MANSPALAAIKPEQGCIQAYTFLQVKAHIKRLHDARRSLRQIANEDYGGQINHAVIQRCLAGVEPTDKRIRLVLGLSTMIPCTPINGHHIPEGTQVFMARQCINDDCEISFSPNSPKRWQCFKCNPVRKRR